SRVAAADNTPPHRGPAAGPGFRGPGPPHAEGPDRSRGRRVVDGRARGTRSERSAASSTAARRHIGPGSPLAAGERDGLAQRTMAAHGADGHTVSRSGSVTPRGVEGAVEQRAQVRDRTYYPRP